MLLSYLFLLKILRLVVLATYVKCTHTVLLQHLFGDCPMQTLLVWCSRCPHVTFLYTCRGHCSDMWLWCIQCPIKYHIIGPKGGYPSIRHNELRELTASLLKEVCREISRINVLTEGVYLTCTPLGHRFTYYMDMLVRYIVYLMQLWLHIWLWKQVKVWKEEIGRVCCKYLFISIVPTITCLLFSYIIDI